MIEIVASLHFVGHLASPNDVAKDASGSHAHHKQNDTCDDSDAKTEGTEKRARKCRASTPSTHHAFVPSAFAATRDRHERMVPSDVAQNLLCLVFPPIVYYPVSRIIQLSSLSILTPDIAMHRDLCRGRIVCRVQAAEIADFVAKVAGRVVATHIE